MAEILKNLLESDDYIESVSNLSSEELEKCIIYANDIYYSCSSIINDNYYDILIDFLKLKNSKSKLLKNIGSPIKSKDKVKLDYWLGSMDKIKPNTKELNNWIKGYRPPYNISDKLDGISALLVYGSCNDTIKLFTRGTANEGMDISFLVKYLNLPSYDNIKKYCNINKIKGTKNLIAFRGELIIKSDIFNKNWSHIFKNGRNTVAGLVNSKNINPDLASDTDLVLYEIIDPFYNINEQLKIIKELGFNTVFNKTINNELDFEYLSYILVNRKKKSIYQIDGIIITSINNHIRNIKGNPEYAFAYKDISEDQIAITKIISIEWNISKNGNIIPTIIIEPVTIGGVLIKRTTGFNAKYIIDNKLGPKAEIELIRSGDVIPYIKKIIKSASKPQMPDNSLEWIWDDTQTHIKINNNNNKDLLIKNIYYFFSTLETKGLGEKIIEKLVNHGLDSIYKIITVNKDKLILIEGIKEKSAINILNAIQKSLINIPLYKLMAASNKLGNGIGQEKIKLILNVYPNIINDYSLINLNKLINIKGWDEKTASLFLNNFPNFIKFYNEIKKFITIEQTKLINSILSNIIIVLSGFRDKQLQDNIIKNGGTIGATITKKTNYLIVKDKTIITDKISKAEELNINILTIDEFLRKYKLTILI